MSWTWEPGSADESRPLHSDFDTVPLEGRTVVILFDTDEERNANVLRARCLLAQRLVERGAGVKVMELPTEKNDHGEFVKVGVDDLIVRHGSEVFNRLLSELIEPCPIVNLSEYRAAMGEAIIAASRRPGIHLVRCPTGSGKSYSLKNTLRQHRLPALIVQPTHRQNDELIELCAESDILISSFPKLSPETCENFEAVVACVRLGVPRQVFCNSCRFQGTCTIRHRARIAAGAPYSACTHARFMRSHSVSDGKRQIHIHEAIPSLLGPTMQLEGDFHVLRDIIETVKDRCRCSDDIVRYCNLLRVAVDDATDLFCLDESDVRVPLRLPRVRQPVGVLEELYREIDARHAKSMVGTTLQYCRQVLSHRVRRVVVHVDTIGEHARQTISVLLKSPVPRRASRRPYLLYDATLGRKTAEKMLGAPVDDVTPPGRLRPLHRIIQHPDADIKIRTRPERLRMILISLLFLRYPDSRRIGIICHKNHRSVIESFRSSLAAEHRDRIVIVEHFRGSISRGSNLFQRTNLDTLLILGTPRVPKPVVRNRVVQCNEIPYIDSEWQSSPWGGTTETGKYRIVNTMGYSNHDWHDAMTEIVGSELVQAIGRARIFNEDGIPRVVLLSDFNTGLTAEDGLVLADDNVPKITNMALRDLRLVAETLFCPPMNPNGVAASNMDQTLRPAFANNSMERFWVLAEGGSTTGDNEDNNETNDGKASPAFCRMSSTQLAGQTGIAKSTMTRKLDILVRLGLVTKIGERGGYTLTPENWTAIRLILPLMARRNLRPRHTARAVDQPSHTTSSRCTPSAPEMEPHS